MTAAPRKLLVITDEMEVGGTQRQIVALLKGIDRRRFQPSLVYFRSPSFMVDELRHAGIPVTCIPKRRRIDPAFFLALRRHIREGGFDIVHCFSFSGELWGMLAHRFGGRGRFVSSIRGTYGWYSRLQWWLKALVSRHSCCVVANSVAGAAYAVEQKGASSTQTVVVYNGVAVPPLTPGLDRNEFRAGLGLSATTVAALFVGRLVEHKNVPSLLRAADRLRRQAVDFVVLLAGDGPLTVPIQQLIQQLGLESCVRLLGERGDVGDLLAASDFLVLPSYREGLANVIMEAMAAGRAVIASHVGGNGELVQDDKNGLLYASDDDAALAAAMSRLILNPSERVRLSAAACARAGEFSIEQMVRRMEQVYSGVMETSGHGGK
jgi:glycosyltransferase involved in cell wall biosynthesis